MSTVHHLRLHLHAEAFQSNDNSSKLVTRDPLLRLKVNSQLSSCAPHSVPLTHNDVIHGTPGTELYEDLQEDGGGRGRRMVVIIMEFQKPLQSILE